jgi:hypothetical protein
MHYAKKKAMNLFSFKNGNSISEFNIFHDQTIFVFMASKKTYKPTQEIDKTW